jgi:hypothetical protein
MREPGPKADRLTVVKVGGSLLAGKADLHRVASADGVADDAEIRSRMLSCLTAAGVRCDRVPQPSGRSGLGRTVHQDDLATALSGLHDHFFTPAEPSHPS